VRDFTDCLSWPAPLSKIAAQNTAIAVWAPKCLLGTLPGEQEGIPGLFPKMAIGSGMKEESVRATSDACLGRHTLYQAALFETDRHKIPERIDQAERAIIARVRELFVVTGDHIEEDQVKKIKFLTTHCTRSEPFAAACFTRILPPEVRPAKPLAEEPSDRRRFTVWLQFLPVP